MLDFKTKTRPCQIVPVSNEKNATFLAINHSLVSFDKDTYKGNKKIPTRLTLIRALAPGWASAPYKKSQKTARPQRLSEFTGGPIPAMRFYSFEKVPNNSEKGPRCNDITFELQAGNALNFWLDEKRLGEIKDTIPNGLVQIPAFTVCEIEIASKNNEAISKGYGCTIKKIKPRDITLYSCLQDIEAFPPTFIDASTALLKHQKAQTYLGNDLVTNEPSFFIHVTDKAYIHEDPEQPCFVTLVNSGIDPVDIPLPTLLQYTNSTKKEQACSLLEMAIANGALQLFVVHNDYWKNATNSSLRGIPIVNTELLLQSIVPARVGEQTCFQTPNTITVEDVTYNIQIHVDAVCVFFIPSIDCLAADAFSTQEPVSITNGLPPRSPDLVLTCLQVELERAYKIRFALNSPTGDEIPRYWVGYFDASPRKIAPATGFHKRKFTPADEEEELDDE